MAKSLLLAPGFRFHPTDDELSLFYLKRRVLGKKISVEAVTELDIYKHAPWDLPAKSCLPGRDLKWYFFCPTERKYATGARLNRATEFGYWKTTGNDRPVVHKGVAVARIKTLVFHNGRPPRGGRTNWVMHEYQLTEKALDDVVVQDSYVLCKIFQKEGPGPRNGAQYGAPFREEDWTDGEEENRIEVGNTSKQPVPTGLVVDGDNNAPGGTEIPVMKCIGSSSESCVSGVVMPCTLAPKPASSTEVGHNNSVAIQPYVLRDVTGFRSPPQSCVSDAVALCNDVEMENNPASNDNDDLLSLLDYFAEDESIVPIESCKNKDTNNLNQDNAVTVAASADGIDIYKDLNDLDNFAVRDATLSFDEIFASSNHDADPYVELRDLDMPLAGDGEDEDNQLKMLFASFNRDVNDGL